MTDPQRRPSMSGEYWGLDAITKRIGCSKEQLHRLHNQLQFPLILLPNFRRRHPRNMAFRWRYYTNEDLITKWYFATSRAQRNLKRKLGGRWWRVLGKAGRGDLTTEASQKVGLRAND